MKTIIIGSKGFIGQHLHTHLSKQGHEVWGADVLTDYVNQDRYFQIDASNSDFTNVFQNTEFDLCVNCSGAASVPDSLKNPLRDYYLNTVNVYRMLEAIKKEQPNCKFINLSSAAVYGNPKKLPIEETSPVQPLSPYGIHKLQSDQICSEFYEFYDLKTCTLRIFSVYGAGLQKQLFWDLYRKARSGEAFTLYGTGDESRDFIHVDDLVRVIELVAEKSDFKADVINVANGTEVFIKDAVSTFFNCFDTRVKYSFSGESREGDPRNWRADISKLLSLGYSPTVDMAIGLNDYFHWIDNAHPQ